MTEWIWRYEGYDVDEEGLREALTTLGNGYFATRGALAESDADGIHYPGTYVAGAYNRLYADVDGHLVDNESLVNVPNWLVLRLRPVGGEFFTVDLSEVLEHWIELDLERGLLTRRSRVRDGDGRVLSITQRRFVSLRDRHIAAMETTLVAENWSGPLGVTSALDGRVTNGGVERYRELDNDHLEPVEAFRVDAETICLGVRTNHSRVDIAQTARIRVFSGGHELTPDRIATTEDRYVDQRFTLDLVEGEEVIIEKVVAMFTSRDVGIYEPHEESHHWASVIAGSFDELLDRHVVSWAHAWRRSRIEVEGNDGTAKILNLHIFHLLQTISKNNAELDAGVPARGLHGEAYRGHVFWDEVFIFPFLNWRVPELARTLLRYRARRLDQARRNAAAAGFRGAVYPWQSASNGREETQTLHLNPKSGRWLPDASHLQRHINAAIVYMVWHYWEVNRDLEFMRFWGAEMILEIARFWSSASSYNHALDRYEIRGVMGPDEYHEGYPGASTPGLDNNAYTNIMAIWCICRAFDVLEMLPADRAAELREKLGITAEELGRWSDLTHKMRVPFTADGVIAQFEGWDDLAELDWDAYRERYGNIQRLDRILEAEGDNTDHYKLAKQADTLMLFFLLSGDEVAGLLERLGYDVTPDLIHRTIEYYEPRTAHGSTLSMMVHAWLHARHHRGPEGNGAWAMFRAALHSDVDDVQGGTTREGIHLGAMAGTVDLAQRCFTGIETRDDVLVVDPVIPPEMTALRFTLTYRGCRIALEATASRVAVSLVDDGVDPGATITVAIRGVSREMRPGERFEVDLS